MTIPNPTIDRPLPLLDSAAVPSPFVWADLFGNSNPVELEIGSGKGLFLVNAARANPGHNFFGIEIARKYAGLAVQRVVKNGLSNVRVWAGDAKPVLATMIPSHSLRAVHVYFPDPWWKKRHKKRRVFTEALVDDIQRLLVIDGELSIASDVEEYFQVIRELVATRPMFRELPVGDVRAPEHDLDYLTNFERKFRIQGRTIHRARYGCAGSA
jgi:tRNA (guanine-N7-)-methyltransferase